MYYHKLISKDINLLKDIIIINMGQNNGVRSVATSAL